MPGTFKESFGIFNNKGGVGKTTLAFQLLCEFARAHPNDVVVALDMCPQANLSQMLLTRALMAPTLSVTSGDHQVKKQMRSLDSTGLPKTVAGVIAGIMDNGMFLQSTSFKDDILIRPSE